MVNLSLSLTRSVDWFVRETIALLLTGFLDLDLFIDFDNAEVARLMIGGSVVFDGRRVVESTRLR